MPLAGLAGHEQVINDKLVGKRSQVVTTRMALLAFGVGPIRGEKEAVPNLVNAGAEPGAEAEAGAGARCRSMHVWQW